MKFVIFLLAIGAILLFSGAASKNLSHEIQTRPEVTSIVEIPSRSDGYPDGCQIKATYPYDGHIGAGGYRLTFPNVKANHVDLFIGFICLTTKTDEWRSGMAAKLNNSMGIWEKDIPNRMGSNGDTELFELLDKTVHVFQLKSKNSSGFLVTEDETMGEESRRERMMIFCLLHAAQVLCGEGRVMRLEEPRSDRLPDVLKVLRSIEFVDE